MAKFKKAVTSLALQLAITSKIDLPLNLPSVSGILNLS